jgi:hypothetical protein
MLAKAAARFTQVVVLPTPPFWFAIAMIRAVIGLGEIFGLVLWFGFMR